MSRYEEKKVRLLEDFAAVRVAGGIHFGLAKKTSNLFRDRAARPRIDLSHFNEVLCVDPASGSVEA